MIARYNRVLLAAALMLAMNAHAYTEVNTHNHQDEKPVYLDQNNYYPGTFLLVHNSATIASNLKFRGVNLSGNQVGISDDLRLSMNRGPLQTFLHFDLYGYNANIPGYQSQAGPTYNTTSGGTTMIGSTLGMRLFLNLCRDSSIALTRSVYQWPNAQVFYFQGNPADPSLAYGLNTIKPIKTTDLTLTWRHYTLVSSFADTSSLTPADPSLTTETMWPYTWNDYFAITTPNYPLTGGVHMNAHYGYWKRNGIELRSDFTYALSKQIDSVVRVYNFKSFYWNQASNAGIIGILKFKVGESFIPSLP